MTALTTVALTRFRNFWSPPLFADEERTRLARLLTIITHAILLAQLGGLIVGLLDRDPQTLLAMLLLMPISVITMGMIRQGHLQAATLLQVLTLLGGLNYLVFVGNGVHDVVMLMFPGLVLMGSLLLNQRNFIILVGLCLLSIAAAVGAEMSGLTPRPNAPNTSLTDFLIIAIIMTVISVVARLMTNDLQKNLARARANERTLGKQTEALQVLLAERHDAENVVQQLNASLEARVARRTAQLEAKNRELETFTYSVSHDLKAPLRGIDGYARLLLDDHSANLDEEALGFLHTIRSASQQMNQLINDLLAYSHLEQRPVAPQPVVLSELVECALAEREAEMIARGIALDINVPQATVWAESEWLQQALHSLLDNALKFCTQPAAKITIGGEVWAEHVLLWIQDDGIGFDMQYHDRIFELFQRLNRAEKFPGTGIGLALVSKVMQRIGGRVWAESCLGSGATFYLQIPTMHGGANNHHE